MFEGFLNKNKQKVEGDPAAAEQFAERLRELEPGASDKDVEMAANALALKFKDAAVTDQEVKEMYHQRIAARPNMPGDLDAPQG
jgi:hypothetical protein